MWSADMLNYIMQWPEVVDKSLGSDRTVNEFAKKLFNEESFAHVKSVINKVGAMSKEDTSGTDTMDPFIHTWKVQDRPDDIKDGDKTYGWRKCTQATQATALNNADSYAYLAMGTWLIKKFGASISSDGVIEGPDELAPRNEWVGLPWFA
ncbi:uncharacterized protein N7498_002827 [Penicillium cinerascens]|uniref:Uncharacterized protein n=1 Tax=Penicillium cinerascens TaxID=70096 RepID=A0A9W9NAQ8_9EURO|nr:uncharacterized protein N7498_002827 [Penicillium cinerascens]KAJ5216420.1 hypothetical protein N7498_002827 [Penicillium cinerascens]